MKEAAAMDAIMHNLSLIWVYVQANAGFLFVVSSISALALYFSDRQIKGKL